MSIHLCANRRVPATPSAVVREAMWVIAADALVIVVLTLVFGCIGAGANELTTWPMPSGPSCAPAAVHSCVVAAGVSINRAGCRGR